MNTEYIVWQENYGFLPEDLQRAREIILEGGLVAFPTETVYGLGGDGLRKEASRKIYQAKGRPSDNPLILHIGSKEELYPLVDGVSEIAERLMERFWPGPLTLIFNKSAIVPLETTGGLDTVAIRMPNHKGALDLLQCVKVPLAAPSANTSGRPSPTKASHVKEDLDGTIDMIIDGGQVGIGIESTIVDVTEKIPTILRPGFVTLEMIRQVVGDVIMDPGLSLSSEEKPKAPGMKYRHYAPKGEMTIVEGNKENTIKAINEKVSQYAKKEVGVLATEETKDCYPGAFVITMGSREKKTLSRELYGALRSFDEAGVKVIFSESFSNEPDGVALMNRLKKAAGHRIVQV